MSATTAISTAADYVNAPLLYKGKVREIYDLGEQFLIVVTDRISAFDYVLSPAVAEASLDAAPSELVLVGHSHVALAFTRRRRLEGGLAPAGTTIALSDGEALLNPGSVGQPRDGDPRAAWLLVDFERGRASFRRTSYPIEATQDEIREAGLPASLAERLAVGT